jgi:hypothetical protein
MMPLFLGGGNAGLVFGSSDVILNDTLIEGNEALYVPAIYIGHDSNVEINRYDITDNRALSALYQGERVDGDMAGVAIVTSYEVSMDDVSISNNKADGECAAISNAGTLNLDNVRTHGNTASNYSAIRILREGRVNMGKDVKIFDNNAPQDVHSEGVLNMDLS